MSDGYMLDGKARPGFEGQAGLIAFIHFREGRYDDAAARAKSPAYCEMFSFLGGRQSPEVAYVEIHLNAGAAGVAYRRAKEQATAGRRAESAASLAEALRLYPDPEMAEFARRELTDLLGDGPK